MLQGRQISLMQQLGKMKKRKMKTRVFPIHLRKIYRGQFSSGFLGSTTEKDVCGGSKGISFCLNFVLAPQRRFRASVKMQFLLDARIPELECLCSIWHCSLGTVLEGRGLT